MLAFPTSLMKSGGVTYDADAQTFFTAVAGAGGTIGATMKTAISTHKARGRSFGWLSKVLWEMYFCGDFAAGMMACCNGLGTLQPTVDNFVAGDYSEATGLIGDGSTKKIRAIGVVPPGAVLGMGGYLRVGGASGNRWFGSTNGTQVFVMRRAATTTNDQVGGTIQNAKTPARLIGAFHSRRNGDTLIESWNDGVSYGTTTTSAGAATNSLDMWAFCMNNSGVAASFLTATGVISHLHVNNGTMSDAETVDYEQSVIALQTAKGCNV